MMLLGDFEASAFITVGLLLTVVVLCKNHKLILDQV